MLTDVVVRIVTHCRYTFVLRRVRGVDIMDRWRRDMNCGMNTYLSTKINHQVPPSIVYVERCNSNYWAVNLFE